MSETSPRQSGVTIEDIAARANVSKMTVSRVLRNSGQVAASTRERIEAVIHELDYQPNLLARSLSSKNSMILGVVLQHREHLFEYDYTSKVLSGILDAAMAEGYQVMLCPSDDEADVRPGYTSLVKSRLLDGLVLLKRKLDDPQIRFLVDAEFPFVLLNHRNASRKVSYVDSKNTEGARLAVEYLASKGHRKIGFVRGKLNESNSDDRFAGFVETLDSLKLPFRENWVIQGDYQQEKAYRECDKLFADRDRPTAIFCADDNMAIGVLRRLEELGLKVPKEIAVIGFDDVAHASMLRPALTTIRQPIYDIGKAGTSLLIEQIRGERKRGAHRFLDVELIRRETA